MTEEQQYIEDIEGLESELFAAFPVPHVMPMDEYLASMLGLNESECEL